MMPAGHWIACYQHRWFDDDWHTKARERFSRALDIPDERVEIFASQDPEDVIILAATRQHEDRNPQENGVGTHG